MLEAIVNTIRRFGEKRFVALVLAPAFLALAFDVAADHVADKVVEHPLQVPGAVAPVVCALLLLAMVLPRLGPAWFRRMSWVTGVVSLVTGLAGTWFHLVRLNVDMEGVYTWESFLETLTVTPPLLAPLAFVGLAGVLFALGSERLTIAVAAGEVAVAPETQTAA